MAENLQIQLPYQFEIRHYQSRLWNYLKNGGKRAVWVCHRKAGKDIFAINWIARESMRRVGLYAHIFPTKVQANDVIWQGRTKEVMYQGKLNSGREYLGYFPDELILDKNNTHMRLTLRHPDNPDQPGSKYQLFGADYADALRGPNYIGAVFSEFSQVTEMREAWNIVRPVLAQNGGWAIFIFTPVMKHGETIYNMAQRNPSWFSELLTVDDTFDAPAHLVQGWSKEQIAAKYPPVVTKEAIQEERAGGMPEEDIKREFYCCFASAGAGTWFAKEINEMGEGPKGRITTVRYIDSIPVMLGWDLGWDDDLAIWFIQLAGSEIHLIDFFALNHINYPDIAKMLREKPYKMYGKMYFPHDVKVTEQGVGKSRIEQMIELGILRWSDYVPVEQHNEVEGISVVRSLFSRFWIDADKCADGLEALKSYGMKFDKRNEIYKAKHDKFSHAASALRTFAVGFKDPVFSNRGYRKNQPNEIPEESLLG